MGSNCYWIKKQLEPFNFHPLKNVNLDIIIAMCVAGVAVYSNGMA